jgi:CBS domain-containing membrane protein
MRWHLRVLRLRPLARRHRPRVVFAVFGGVSASISIGVIAIAAAMAHRPLLVPSLGPTAFLIFERPRLAAAAPRNVVVGHGLGILVGEIALRLAGAGHSTNALGHLSAQQAGAGALSVAVVMVVMVVIDIPHPPAAATTLIVSLGLLSGVREVAALLAAVLLLAAQGFVIDRLVGLDYPSWVPKRVLRRDAGPAR